MKYYGSCACRASQSMYWWRKLRDKADRALIVDLASLGGSSSSDPPLLYSLAAAKGLRFAYWHFAKCSWSAKVWFWNVIYQLASCPRQRAAFVSTTFASCLAEKSAYVLREAHLNPMVGIVHAYNLEEPLHMMCPAQDVSEWHLHSRCIREPVSESTTKCERV